MTAFHSELKRAMTRRQQTRADLVRATGSCTTLVKRWMVGEAYPDHPTVVTLADHLHWPALVERSLADRTGTCEACDAPTFVTRGTVKARFCGDRCRSRTRDRLLRARTGEQERKVLRYRLEEHQAAVRAFCSGCTLGEGLCRDAACVLRPVSPLPLVPLRRVA